MARNPAGDIAAFLATKGYGTTGVSLFLGLERPSTGAIPASAVFIHNEPGREPDRVFGRDREVRWGEVQIVIRSTAFSAGDVTARAMFDEFSTGTIGDYLCKQRQSAPIALPPDPAGLYRFSINLLASYQTT